MRILHLVLFSEAEPGKDYEAMRKIITPLYQSFAGYVDTYYISLQHDLPVEACLAGDRMLFSGVESHVPGCLDKTMRALAYFKDDILTKYDYVIRSNISTIINMRLMKDCLQTNKIEFGGAFVMNLNWNEEWNGTANKPWLQGLSFTQGSCIILCRDLAVYMLANQDKLDMTTIDDVAIAYMLKQTKNIEPRSINQWTWIGKNITDDEEMIKMLSQKHTTPMTTIVYRNKHNDRKVDLWQMAFLVRVILDSEKNCPRFSVRFGTEVNNVDVTASCVSELMTNDDIVIPGGFIERDKVFGDPMYGVVKDVFVWERNAAGDLVKLGQFPQGEKNLRIKL